MDMDVQRYKEERKKNVKEEEKDIQEVLSRAREKRPPGDASGLDDEEVTRTDDLSDDDDDQMDVRKIFSYNNRIIFE